MKLCWNRPFSVLDISCQFFSRRSDSFVEGGEIFGDKALFLLMGGNSILISINDLYKFGEFEIISYQVYQMKYSGPLFGNSTSLFRELSPRNNFQ